MVSCSERIETMLSHGIANRQ
ncbi:hypothetical protein LCGC14_2953430, partial [marine sediment metagenome]